MWRTVVERLARGRTLQRTMVVDGRPAPLIVSPDAQLKYLKVGGRSFDRDLIELAERRVTADSVVWDVGANVGTFSVAAAQMATRGKVIAFEADIWLAGLLRRTALLPHWAGRIEVMPCAIAGRCGTAQFLIAKRGRASNALASSGGRSQMGGVRETQLVPTLTLDVLLATLPPPNFVKIDVEGAEFDVVSGASDLLTNVRPVCYVEVDERRADEVSALFARHRYEARDPRTDRPIDRCLENTLFVPIP